MLISIEVESGDILSSFISKTLNLKSLFYHSIFYVFLMSWLRLHDDEVVVEVVVVSFSLNLVVACRYQRELLGNSLNHSKPPRTITIKSAFNFPFISLFNRFAPLWRLYLMMSRCPAMIAQWNAVHPYLYSSSSSSSAEWRRRRRSWVVHIVHCFFQ